MKKYNEKDKNEIRKSIIIGIFSDDKILDNFALKGGNALYIAYSMSERASMDIDLSMRKDFENLLITRHQFEKTLKKNISEALSAKELEIIDFKLEDSPKKTDKKFWGGYRVTFKVIDAITQNRESTDLQRKKSISLGKGEKKDITIDISKYEFIDDAIMIEMDDNSLVHTYSLTMIIAEKLRAICQQMPEYKELMRTKVSPRPRDFYDIYTIFENKKELRKEILNDENKEMIRKVFEIKKVPLDLLGKINLKETKEFHEKAYETVTQSIYSTSHNENFDYYFKFVCTLVEDLNLNN